MKKRADGAKGYLEEPDPYRTKTRDGKTILCFSCGLAASAAKRLRIIGCGACEAHFHLECLDPPLVTLPSFPYKWVCPLHMHKTLPGPQAAQQSRTIPINTLNTPNNGNIDVIVTPQSRTKAKHVEEVIINRVKYQVPENIIILDFWAKLGQSQAVPHTEVLDLPLAPPINQASTSASALSKNARVAQASNFSREDVGSSSSSSDTHIPLSSLPPPPRPSSSTIPQAARSDLSCLLQAAQQVNEAPRSQPSEGLALLGNAASLQSPLTSNLRKSHKKKDIGQPQRTRTRGSARLSKSTSTPSETPDIETAAQKPNTPGQPLAPSLKIPPTTSSASSKHVDSTKPSNSSSPPVNLHLQPHASEGPNPSLRKRKKRSPAHSPSSTTPTDLAATETSLNSTRPANKDASHVQETSLNTIRPPNKDASHVQSTTAINGVIPKMPITVQTVKPDAPRPHTTTTAGVARPNNTASKNPTADKTKLPSNSQGSKDQSIQARVSSAGSLNKQIQSESAAATSNNHQSPLVPPKTSTGIKTPNPNTTSQHVPKALPNLPMACYNSFAQLIDLRQIRTSSANGKKAASTFTATPSFQSFNSATSSLHQKTSLGQLPKSTLPRQSTSATTTPHVPFDLREKNTAASDTGSVTRPPRKRTRRNHPDPLSQSTNSTHPSNPAESPTVALSTLSISQPFSSTSNTSQTYGMSVDPSLSKATANRGDVPGRTTINRGQKPGKAPPNKAENSLLTSEAPGLKATASGSATVVQSKHRDPAIHVSHPTASSASGSIPLPTSMGPQDTLKRSALVTAAAFDKSSGTGKSAQRHVAPDLMSQSAPQSARLPNDTGNSSPSTSTPKTKAKRKKSVKNPSPLSHLDQKQPAEEGQRNLSLLSRDSASEAADAILLDPRLTASTTNYEMPKAPKPASKPTSSVEGSANLNAKISIALARFENDQGQLPVSTVPAKVPPRKKIKRKSAPATGSTCSSGDPPSMTRGTPSIESTLPPPSTSLSKSSLRPAAAAFVPHPQHPQQSYAPSAPLLSQSSTRPAAAAFVPHPQNPMTLVPQPQRVCPVIGHPNTLAFVPHPQNGPGPFSGSGLPYVPHPQYPGTMRKSGSSSFVLSSRKLSHEGPSSQSQSRRGSLTVHGSSPPLLAATASPGTALPNESKFAGDASRPSSAVGSHSISTPRESVFIPLPLTKPVKTPDSSSSWK
ncbi:hypothetical protein PtB15_2B586 [Puccinia triticina]|nr:hypothetical protein PtB15_2B586 [Puccinia triticina]